MYPTIMPSIPSMVPWRILMNYWKQNSANKEKVNNLIACLRIFGRELTGQYKCKFLCIYTIVKKCEKIGILKQKKLKKSDYFFELLINLRI